MRVELISPSGVHVTARPSMVEKLLARGYKRVTEDETVAKPRRTRKTVTETDTTEQA